MDLIEMPTAFNFIKSSLDSLNKIRVETRPKDSTAMEGLHHFLRKFDPKIHRMIAHLPDGCQDNDKLIESIKNLTNKVS